MEGMLVNETTSEAYHRTDSSSCEGSSPTRSSRPSSAASTPTCPRRAPGRTTTRDHVEVEWERRRPTRPPRSLLRRLRQLGPNFGIPTCRPLWSVASDRRRPDGNATSSLLPRARFGEGARRDRIANAVGSGRSLLRRRFRRQRQPVGANRSRPRRRRPADIDGESRTRSSAFRPPPLRRRRTVRFSDDAPPPGHDYLADRASLWSDPRVAICTANPGDVVAFHFRTLHAAPGTTSADRHHGGRRTVVSFRYLGDDARWATRPWKTSPPFADEGLVPGDVLDEGRFPIVDL